MIYIYQLGPLQEFRTAPTRELMLKFLARGMVNRFR